MVNGWEFLRAGIGQWAMGNMKQRGRRKGHLAMYGGYVFARFTEK